MDMAFAEADIAVAQAVTVAAVAALSSEQAAQANGSAAATSEISPASANLLLSVVDTTFTPLWQTTCFIDATASHPLLSRMDEERGGSQCITSVPPANVRNMRVHLRVHGSFRRAPIQLHS